MWRAVLAIALVYAFVGLVVVRSARFLTASTFWRAHLADLFFDHPLDVLLLPGAAPLAAALYAPLAPLGHVAICLAHVGLGAITLLLVAWIARARGTPSPQLAAFVMATSPAFFGACVAGVVGADGALLVALSLFVWDVRQRPRVAASLLGLLVLLRPEMVILGAGLAFVRGDRRALAITVAIPLTLLAIGILLSTRIGWAHDFLLTPALAGPVAAAGLPAALSESFVAVVAVLPAVGLLALLSEGTPAARERDDAFVALVFVAVVLFEGALDVGSVGLAPERLVPALPLLCPLVARVIASAASEAERTPPLVVLFGMLLIAELVVRLGGGVWVAGAVGAAALVVSVARAAPRITAPFTCAVMVGGLFLLLPATRLYNEEVPRFVHVLRHAEELEGHRIVTDATLLAPILGESEREIRFVWRGRAAAPLGLDEGDRASSTWLLEGHPFGEPIFDASPRALSPGDVAVVTTALAPVYDASPLVEALTSDTTSIYVRREVEP
jgi:hypothetical protein